MSLFIELEYQYGVHIVNWYKVRDVYKIETKQQGLYCLKLYRLPVEEVQFIADVQEHLVQNGFMYSPRIRLTREKTSYFNKDGIFYMLTNWIDGHHPRFQNKSQLETSICALANFHRRAKDISVTKVPKKRFRAFSLEKRFKSALQVIKQDYPFEISESLAIQRLCEKALDQLRDKEVQKAIENEAKVKAFVHGDYNYPNLVVDGNGNHQLIDFDNTSLHVRMEDLAHFMHRNSPWQADGILRMVEVYDHVRPISQADFRLLIALLHEPYPFIRAIHQKNRHPNLSAPKVPGKAALKAYSRQLCVQM